MKMERPPQRYFCNKCGYVGNVDLHPGCGYLAYHLAPFEQNYIDQLEKELADIKKLSTSPASAPEGWKHSCNALCIDGVELWIPQCPHCGKPAPTPPVSECVDPVMTKEELIAAAESIGMRFTGTHIPPVSEDQRDAERLRFMLDDHAEKTTRQRVRELFERLPVMSLSAARAAIDAAMYGEVK